MSLFATIRTACRAVADQAEFVHIDADRIPAYAGSLPLDTQAASLDPAHHYRDNPDKTLAFVLTLDAINFGSGYFPHIRKRPGLSGYRTVASALSDWFEARDAVTPDDLLAMTPARCADIFGQTDAPSPLAGELMTLFGHALRDLGQFVIEHHGGAFANLVAAAGGSAARLVRELENMPFYRDVHRYRDMRVPFFKRAQITAADLSLAFHDHPWGRFDDLDQLTIFADNLVPHVLRVDGVLHFAGELVNRVNREEVIPLGSPEEIEIRACGLTAVEEIVRVLREQGRHACAKDLDYLLWNRGQQPEYKAHPRHRSRGVHY